MAIVGSGDHRYERVPSWPEMPKYWAFGAASDGAVNSKDEVHIFSRGEHPLTIWDTNGNFISSWGEGTFSANPHGIYIGPNDNVWLVDRDFHIATEYTPGGQVLRTLGEKLAPSPSFQGIPFNMPSGLAIAPNGELFVSDGYGGHRVHKFSPEGELLLSWGSPGDKPGEFNLPHSLWVDRFSRVLVCDRENHRIQILDSGGKYITTWPGFKQPTDIYLDSDDIVYVSELGDRVSILDIDGNVLSRWGDERSHESGKFWGAHGIWVCAKGDIYVSEVLDGQRVQKFVRIR